MFVHGWQADRSVWSDVIAALGPEVRPITVDLAGFGDSNAVPGPYTIERFAADLRQLIETLGVAPAIVVGHSMGGKVALRLAVDAPDALRGMVLVAPVPVNAAGFSPKGDARLRATAGDPVAVKDWLARTIDDPSDEPILERLCAAAAKAPREVALESFESWAHTDFADKTGAIAAPALIVAPEHDTTLTESARKLAALLPNATFLSLAGTAHYVIVERPHVIAELISKFVEDVR